MGPGKICSRLSGVAAGGDGEDGRGDSTHRASPGFGKADAPPPLLSPGGNVSGDNNGVDGSGDDDADEGEANFSPDR